MPTFNSSLSSSNDNDVIVGVDVDVGASLAIAASHFAALCPVLAGGVKPLASARVGPSGTVRISENSQRNIRLKSFYCSFCVSLLLVPRARLSPGLVLGGSGELKTCSDHCLAITGWSNQVDPTVWQT